MTKAVILCGGYGTRISEETHKIPKPMIKLDKSPILLHISPVEIAVCMLCEHLLEIKLEYLWLIFLSIRGKTRQSCCFFTVFSFFRVNFANFVIYHPRYNKILVYNNMNKDAPSLIYMVR